MGRTPSGGERMSPHACSRCDQPATHHTRRTIQLETRNLTNGLGHKAWVTRVCDEETWYCDLHTPGMPS